MKYLYKSSLLLPLSSRLSTYRISSSNFNHHYHHYASSSSSSSSYHSNSYDLYRGFNITDDQHHDDDIKYNNGNDNYDIHDDKVSVSIEIIDKPGALLEVLKCFQTHDISLTYIESKPTTTSSLLSKLSPQTFSIIVNYIDKYNMKTFSLLQDLHRPPVNEICYKTTLLGEKEVSWFPTKISDLEYLAHNVLNANIDLVSDHPGFNDRIYRQRRQELTDLTKSSTTFKEIPKIEYSDEEIRTWGVIYKKLKSSHQKYACKEYLTNIKLLEDNCGYSETCIPQGQDISSFLYSKTGFKIRPVAGLLPARSDNYMMMMMIMLMMVIIIIIIMMMVMMYDVTTTVHITRDFLNALAFRVFFSSQYIRHSSVPWYTPEPDICHEYIGHVPLFLDRDFADFSQEIGLASLGASDEDIEKLASCYWFSVEFGLG